MKESNVEIAVWDCQGNDWMDTVYTLPDSLTKVAEAAFEAKKLVVRLTVNGRVRYIMTDRSPVKAFHGGTNEHTTD